jgi:hypothetical protein
MGRTQNQSTGNTRNPSPDNEYVKHQSLSLSSIDLDILKINKIKMAHSDATIPIKAIRLSEANRLEKSKWKMLNTINPNAKKINM